MTRQRAAALLILAGWVEFTLINLAGLAMFAGSVLSTFGTGETDPLAGFIGLLLTGASFGGLVTIIDAGARHLAQQER